MALLPLFNQSYVADTTDVSCQRIVNMYIEPVENKNSEIPYYLKHTPGTSTYLSVGSGSIRAMYVHLDVLYMVVGNEVYAVTETNRTPSIELLGTINSTELPRISIAALIDDILITDGVDLWSYKISTTTFVEVTDPDIIVVPEIVLATQGYFVTIVPGTQYFVVSDLSSSTSYNALSFASKNLSNDIIISGAILNNKLWLLGKDTSEIWEVSANISGAPFDRSAGGALQVGCAAAHSVSTISNQIIFLAQNSNGVMGVCSISQSEGIRVLSSPAMNLQISSYINIEDAHSFVYQKGNHQFYVITFPTSQGAKGNTWMYDLWTGLWTELDSLDIEGQSTPFFHRYFGNCSAFFKGNTLVGDWQSPTIYKLDYNKYTERQDNLIRRLLISSHIQQNRGRLGIGSLELRFNSELLDTSTTGEATVFLEVSKDAGLTWSQPILKTIGTFGQYLKRTIWRRLGTARCFTFKAYMTDAVPWTLLGSWVEIKGSADVMKSVPKDPNSNNSTSQTSGQ